MINTTPLISVIMPVYNGEEFLDKAIESILNQSFQNFEFIIINDGSKDNSQSVIEKYADRRIRLINRENKGLPATLNECISLANGEYIARQDQDDISDINRLKKQVDYLLNNEDYLIVGSKAKYIDENGVSLSQMPFLPISYEQILTFLPIENPFIHGSVMFNAKVKNLNIKYKENCFVEDYNFWYELLKYGKGHNLEEILYIYRIHSSNYCKTFSKQQIDDIKIVKNNIINFYLKDKNIIKLISINAFENNINDFKINELRNNMKQLLKLFIISKMYKKYFYELLVYLKVFYLKN